MLTDLREGIGYVSEGYRLAQRPALRPYMLVPLVLNIVLFSISGWLVVHYAYDWIGGLDTTLDLWSWLDWAEAAVNSSLAVIKWFLFAAIILFLLFLMGSTFTMVVHLLISPFIGILGEQAEKQLHTPAYPQHTLAQIAWRATKRELRKLAYWLVRALGLGVLTLILNFIPGLNLAIPVLWFLFGAWVLALQYIDVPADNNGKSFQEVLALMRANRGAVMGFGGVIMALTSVPIVNLFIVPVAVCGGVVFWVRKIQGHSG
ncbi:MAG TPA: sulfate transporter CysZ [Dongiaceae bacterium]|nr:sulfate transporter CysZ [Dongiaceae bacterium]